jgi:hypothetical protein
MKSLVSILFLWLLSSKVNAKTCRARMFAWRGGALPDQSTTESSSTNHNNNNNNETMVEEYVAAMKEKDGQDRQEEQEDIIPSPTEDDANNPAAEEPAPEPEGGKDDNNEPAIVGVKSHKKSNAVGDPDGDDDDDDSDESLSEYSDEWEDLEGEFDGFVEDLVVDTQVQVEVEVVEEEEEQDDDTSLPSSTGGGGVGVRLGRMNNRRRNNRKENQNNNWRSSNTQNSKLSHDQKLLIEAWAPQIYFPPTPSALAYLSDNARLLDSSSKNRLDRRTLYAGLLLEWGCTDSKLVSSTRKFLPSPASQALQAALSMATQPQWRQSAPRTSGIRLYQDEENLKMSTLGMQETVAMALVSDTKLRIRGRYKILLWVFV